jgi:hypothetical protein
MTEAPRPRFDHLLHMTDGRGTFEHAEFSDPRPEHGYCTDDMARVLIVSIREVRADRAIDDLVELSLRFLQDAQDLDGAYRNRMDRRGRWEDRPTLDDCWGRSVWALGTAAARAEDDWARQVAVAQFDRAARRRSPWPKAMAFAAIGAAETLSAQPGHRGARGLLAAAADGLTGPDTGGVRPWPWPEPALTYANAVIPEAMIAAGSFLDRPLLLRRGLDLLAWLLDHETIDGHLSVTPAGGSAPGAVRPAFDQQPIEVAALADACARAASVDGANPLWADGVERAVGWFLGDNDGSHVMWDPATGGGFDGLEAGGPNRNQGTESTLALLATLQHARHLAPA